MWYNDQGRTKMSSNPKKSKICNVTLNVLGYRDDNEWVALALEMDLRGYGRTFNEAVKELQEIVAMQISFAHFKGQPEMILKPADPIWFERFAEVRSACLASMMEPADHKSIHSEYEISGMPIPAANVIKELQAKFIQSNA
jgi:hypothetical protein